MFAFRHEPCHRVGLSQGFAGLHSAPALFRGSFANIREGYLPPCPNLRGSEHRGEGLARQGLVEERAQPRRSFALSFSASRTESATSALFYPKHPGWGVFAILRMSATHTSSRNTFPLIRLPHTWLYT